MHKREPISEVPMCRFLKILHLVIAVLFVFQSPGQVKKYKLRTIGFYNVENLFDTIDNPETIDEDYTVQGKNRYSYNDYRSKIQHTARVISEIGSGLKTNGPVIIGLAEIEGHQVLDDLVQSDALKEEQYQIIHQDSPDRRGIDVALLYRKMFFTPVAFESIEVKLWDDKGARIYTRDILYVHGILDDEEIHILVNHWPSRRGGKSRSDPKRIKAAYLVKQYTDRIYLADPLAKILIMGDFNDDPADISIKKGLISPTDTEKKVGKRFFNPMQKMHKKGFNTLAYRDGLNLFDQIICSSNLIREEQEEEGFYLYRAGIFNPSYLITKQGRYKGYPLRSFQNSRYAGGYSDHFPVYIELIKEFSKMR